MSRSHLILRSPVGILSLHDALVSAHTSAQRVVALFQKCAYVPGIVIISDSTAEAPAQTDSSQLAALSTPQATPQILGVLSRQLFFERGCLSSGDRGWDQPIENFILADQDQPIQDQPLVVNDRTSILEVALQIRQRPRVFSLEPIVVTFRDGSIRLVDSRDVLFAQAQILLEEQSKADLKNQQIQDYQLQLDSQARVLDDLNQMVNVRNITLQNQQRHLERQQHDLFKRTEATQQMRQRLTDIRQLLDSKVRVP